MLRNSTLEYLRLASSVHYQKTHPFEIGSTISVDGARPVCISDLQQAAGFRSRVGHLVGHSRIWDQATEAQTTRVDYRLIGVFPLPDSHAESAQVNAPLRLDQKSILFRL